MKTKQNKNSSKPIPQIRVRSNIKSGPDTVAPMITDAVVNPQITDCVSTSDFILHPKLYWG